MESARFDGLARAIATVLSRRRLSWALGASVLSVAGLVEAKSCPQCRKKKHGKCRKKRPDDTPCGNGGRCRGGHCDQNVCTLGCAGGGQPQACGPAGAGCQCVNSGDGVGACVKSEQGASCLDVTCASGEVCGIPCTSYLSFCWPPCV
jgi:hypothetical protein